MNNETQQLLTQLHGIAERSLRDDVSWSQPTPSTFQWIKESSDGSLVVSIQRAISNMALLRSLSDKNSLNDPENSDYLFQVQEMSPKRVLVSLSSKDRPELAHAMAEVYASAERGVDSRAARVISKLLD
jgi:hypothetical protein